MSPLSDATRRWLVHLARLSLDAAGRGVGFSAPESPRELPASDREQLESPCAAFVTLLKEGHLRGCVGHTAFDTPLRDVVVQMARAAALDDIRFPPVSAIEVPDLRVEISILSRFFPVEPGQIIPGVHGLMVRKGLNRGLLLPQVASTYHWDAEEFLREACRKAGLSPDAWKRGATVEAFTAEVIDEEVEQEMN